MINVHDIMTIMQTILYKGQHKKGFKIPYFHCGPCIKDRVTLEDMLMKKSQYQIYFKKE